MRKPDETPALKPSGTGGNGAPGLWFSLAAATLFILLAAVMAAFYLRVFIPEAHVAFPEPYEGRKPDAMREAARWRAVKSRQEEIAGKGSRFMGQPGMYQTIEYIRRRFKEAGLEIIEHDLLTAVPQTEYREIYLAPGGGKAAGEGERLRDVEIYPFMPNHMQPAATGDEGLTGELVLLDSETLQSRKRFDNCIGLLDSKEGMTDPDYGYNWLRYAQLGVKALVISHSEGLEHAPWHRIARRRPAAIVSSIPVNYARVAASKEIFRYLGRTVKLRVKCVYANVPHTTLIGVLRAREPAEEAMVLTSSYDACSVLPDMAPGVTQALGPAVQLQLLEGLLPYRDTLRRDIIFVALGASVMAHDGLNNLMRVLGKNFESGEKNPLLDALNPAHSSGGAAGGLSKDDRRLIPLRKDKEKNDARLQTITKLLSLFDDPGFLTCAESTENQLDQLDDETRKFFREQFNYVLNTVVFELSEPLLQAKLRFERLSENDTESEAFSRYLDAKRRYDQAAAAAGYFAVNLLEDKPEMAAEHQARRRCLERFRELKNHHEREAKRIAQEIEIARLFNRYRNFAAFDTLLMPAAGATDREEHISINGGAVDPATLSLVNLMSVSKQRLALKTGLKVHPVTRSHGVEVENQTHRDYGPVLHNSFWSQLGYVLYTFISFERREGFRNFAYPVDLPYMHDVESLRRSLAVTGETVLSLAHGNGRIEGTAIAEWKLRDWGGRVLVSNVGQSIVPNYPLKNALVACRSKTREYMFSMTGYYHHLVLLTNPYGEYHLRQNVSDFPVWWNISTSGGTHTPLACGYDDEGFITYMKDEGEDGQRLFKSVNLSISSSRALKNVTIVVFRASQVAITDVTNPQTMKDYTGVEMISRKGLARFRKMCSFEADGLYATYLQLDQRFYVKLQSGAPENELVKVTRAFMLGIDEHSRLDPEKEIDGEGYLPADHSVLHKVPFEVSRSMAHVNGRRLDLQNRYRMADDLTNEYHLKTLQNIARSEEPEQSFQEAARDARAAVTYATLIHPVLRESIFEAVLGIIWYLGLLVPFVFFFEKLLFCSPDIRKQLAAQAVIFLVVFILLRLLHPAFQMVRSSLMILLGFVIILISGGITILFSGKFKENLEELRKQQGKVTGADVNTLGVMGSAFMLGLNNMHRRKVRTGLTCATLTLLTFAMICFTSVSNDITEERYAVGKAPYQGILVKRERFLPLSQAEAFAITAKYGDRYQVCERKMFLGQQGWRENKRVNPELEAVHTSGGVTRKMEFDSILQFSHNEPLRAQIRFVTRPAWFTKADEKEERLCPVLLPSPLAESLGIRPEQVNRGEAAVRINGKKFEVRGIFDPQSVNKLRDIDGMDLLPFDIESIPNVVAEKMEQKSFITAEDDEPRIDASRLILAPARDLGIDPANSEVRIASMAVVMPGAGYKEAKKEIMNFLEQTAQPAYYGLDGVAYKGKRVREATLAGLIDLLIPLLIAAMTVLNTMKGSVYERRDEIYVYNSVGIAPRYVFFMFIAEAFVYAVVGSILGYLFSQGTGRILTALDLTGGLRMTFTSLSTVYASLTIMAAVFISTWYPAKSAMEIAAPAEEAGWELPEPEGDELSFDLPFNFRSRGRLAVLVFFERYLLDHGEGGAGRFFAGPPRIEAVPSGKADEGLIPQISAATWLKPFDLAVSQRLAISLPPDPETGQYKAKITLERLSGTRDSWLRLNRGFVSLLRRHFLHWRAASEEERQEMFEEAKEKLRKLYPSAETSPA